MTSTMTAQEWLTRGRHTVVGYLHVLHGPRKKSYGLLGDYIVDLMEEAGQAHPERWPDCHAVWFGYDPDGPPSNRHRRPFLRYKASRPIEGLGREHQNHRVEITCSIGEPWTNGQGAYITRAVGRCLDCAEGMGTEKQVKPNE